MKHNQQHICIDLETLGSNPQSPIIQIGAVKFNGDGIYDWFNVNINYEQFYPGLVCDYSTIMWWLKQSDEARRALSEDGVWLYKGLIQLFDWIGNVEDYLYWCHATFDAPILKSSMLTVKLDSEFQIPYHNWRDVRTIVDLFDVQIEDTGKVKHVAVNDAEYEALQVLEGLRKLRELS